MRTRFGNASRGVVQTALTECRLRNDALVGLEHLLIALMHDPTLCATYFRGRSPQEGRNAVLALDRQALRAVGIEVAGDTPDQPTPPSTKRRPDFSAGAKDTLEKALRIASARKSKRIEPRDVLLAVVSQPSPNPALDVLRELGLDPARIAGQLAA